MLKRLFFLAFVALFLVGMGGRGLETFKEVPVPERNYTVSLTDKAGVSVNVSMFSWEGQVYFAGYRGDGDFTVAFDKVERAEFGEVDAKGRVPVRLYLRDGSAFEMRMDADRYFYGKTEYGNYRIRVGSVRFIRFL